MSSSLVGKIRTEIQDFFNLPTEQKKKFWQQPGDVEGFGQAFVVSEDQKLDWADIFFLNTLPVQLRRPHLFPKLPSPFRYSCDLKHMCLSVILCIMNVNARIYRRVMLFSKKKKNRKLTLLLTISDRPTSPQTVKTYPRNRNTTQATTRIPIAAGTLLNHPTFALLTLLCTLLSRRRTQIDMAQHHERARVEPRH